MFSPAPTPADEKHWQETVFMQFLPGDFERAQGAFLLERVYSWDRARLIENRADDRRRETFVPP